MSTKQGEYIFYKEAQNNQKHRLVKIDNNKEVITLKSDDPIRLEKHDVLISLRDLTLFDFDNMWVIEEVMKQKFTDRRKKQHQFRVTGMGVPPSDVKNFKVGEMFVLIARFKFAENAKKQEQEEAQEEDQS